MRFLSALSERTDPAHAAQECARALDPKDPPPDLLLFFHSPDHNPISLASALRQAFDPRLILGVSGAGVLAAGREVESKSALGVLYGWLPGVSLHHFHVTREGMPDPDASPKAWRRWVNLEAPPAGAGAPAAFLLFCDPFSIDPEQAVAGLDYAFPGSVKIGGMASGASKPGVNALHLNGALHRSGAIGLALSGPVAVDPLVAQGCRPIGEPLRITRCERNLLLELDGRPTLKVLKALFNALSPQDLELARNSLFLGLLNDPLQAPGEPKNFLIRNLVGMDPKSGVLAIGAALRPGQTVQFHLRDKVSSAQDLEKRLAAYAAKGHDPAPQGALLFSCLGRGKYLYGKPDHDSQAFLKALGPLPLAGFFCNGEIGPVAGRTYIHGYTSCFAVLRPT